jgi:hypothetical protein
VCFDVELFDVSASSIGNSHGLRSTYLLHKKDKEFSGLRLAGVSTIDVYVSGRFVEHFASVNRLGRCPERSSKLMGGDSW